MRAALYHRISAAHPGEEMSTRLGILRQATTRRGWEVVGEYFDRNRRHDAPRPGYMALCGAIDARAVDIVVVQQLHRLWTRPEQALLGWAGWASPDGVGLWSLDGAIDTTAGAGAGAEVKVVLDSLRRFVVGRRAEVLAVGQATGRVGGRGGGRPVRVVDHEVLARHYHAGLSYDALQRLHGISRGTLVRHLQHLRDAGRISATARAQAAVAKRSEGGG